jgi:hypothetical protein
VPELEVEPDAGGLVGFAVDEVVGGEDVDETVVVGDEVDEDDFGNGAEVGDDDGFVGAELEGPDEAEPEDGDGVGGGTGDPTGLAGADAWVGAAARGAGVVFSFG